MIWWHFASRGSDEMSEDCWWEVESTMSGATRYPSSDSYSDIEDGRHDNVDMACRLHIHDYTWVSLCCSTCASSRGFLSVLFLSAVEVNLVRSMRRMRLPKQLVKLCIAEYEQSYKISIVWLLLLVVRRLCHLCLVGSSLGSFMFSYHLLSCFSTFCLFCLYAVSVSTST